MSYTLEELQVLLKEFHENHPLLHYRETYAPGKDTETSGAANFLWWLSHEKEYNIDYNWFYGSL